MYQEEAICNREIYKNAEINVLKHSTSTPFPMDAGGASVV
jgi:hypothetical protein